MKNILHKVKVSYSVYILILLALVAGYIKNIFLIMLIVIIHELGHVFFFTLFKIEIDKVVIYPFGGYTYVNMKIHERLYKSFLISIGGFLFQGILYFIFLLFFINDFIVYSTYKMFIFYNFNIMLFNLIPIIPLDGSKMVFCLLSKFISYKNSYRWMVFLSIFSLGLFIAFNYIYKLNDIVLYLFLVFKLVEVVKEFKYVMNRFYLERIMYDHYYNKIISGYIDDNWMRIDKYYYFKMGDNFINEKDYLRRNRYL